MKSMGASAASTIDLSASIPQQSVGAESRSKG
jgi:hypothetical protein